MSGHVLRGYDGLRAALAYAPRYTVEREGMDEWGHRRPVHAFDDLLAVDYYVSGLRDFLASYDVVELGDDGCAADLHPWRGDQRVRVTAEVSGG